MDHRRFLAHPEAHRPFADGDLFARIGGRAAIDPLVDGLHDSIEVDAALRPLFGRDLATERESQKRFFTDWLGGEGNYRPYLPHKHRHDLLPITRALAGRWLVHFRGSLEVAVSDVDARRAIYSQARLLARALVNGEEPRSALRARGHGTCLRYQPAIEALDLARRGQAAALRALLKRAPDVLRSAPLAGKPLAPRETRGIIRTPNKCSFARRAGYAVTTTSGARRMPDSRPSAGTSPSESCLGASDGTSQHGSPRRLHLHQGVRAQRKPTMDSACPPQSP